MNSLGLTITIAVREIGQARDLLNAARSILGFFLQQNRTLAIKALQIETKIGLKLETSQSTSTDTVRHRRRKNFNCKTRKVIPNYVAYYGNKNKEKKKKQELTKWSHVYRQLRLQAE